MVNHVRFLVRWESESWESGIVSDLTDRKDTFEEFRIVFTRVGKTFGSLSSVKPDTVADYINLRTFTRSNIMNIEAFARGES